MDLSQKNRNIESNPGPTFVTETAILGSNLECGLRISNTSGIRYVYSSLYIHIQIWLQVKKVFTWNVIEVVYRRSNNPV